MLRVRAIIPEDKIKVLTSNAEVILNFHKTFVHEMEKMVSTPPFKVGDVFLKYVSLAWSYSSSISLFCVY